MLNVYINIAMYMCTVDCDTLSIFIQPNNSHIIAIGNPYPALPCPSLPFLALPRPSSPSVDRRRLVHLSQGLQLGWWWVTTPWSTKQTPGILISLIGSL